MSAARTRLADTFARLRESGQAAFVAYICAGDPDLAATAEIVLGLEEAGVDVIELGLPFSDPLADGVVNQLAAARALNAGTTTPKVIEFIKEMRTRTQIPFVLFTYLNPVYTYGFAKFHADAAAAGADGVLLLDLPPDEAPANAELAETHGLAQIRLIAPTTPPDRAQAIAKTSQGFIYYVSREGVTGEQQSLADNIADQVAIIKAATAVPVCVGFGISTPEQAATVARAADGVVVGSAIVKRVAQGGTPAELRQRIRDFVAPLVQAAKAARTA